MIVSSDKFFCEHRCVKESHSESVSSWALGCVGALGAGFFQMYLY